jgi:prepilin peptidase CpaA
MSVEILSILAKAGVVIVLAYIAASDFTTQKIRNQQLMYLLAGAAALCVLRYMQTGDWRPALLAGAMAAVLFVVLFVFWLLGKVGAGDVKLLAVVPLAVGIEGSLTFMVGLLVLTLATYLVMKFPVLVPERWFRTYLVGLGKTGRVPFGVPISIAAVLALLLPLSIVGTPHAPADDNALFNHLNDPLTLITK